MTGFRVWRTAVLLAVLTAGASGVSANMEPQDRPGNRPPGRRPGGPVASPELRAAMEELLLARLQKALLLTPGQEEKVMPEVKRLLDARRDHASRKRAAMSHLRALLIDETAQEAEIERGLKEARAIEDDFREQESALRRGIESELTSVQRARMFLFEDHFRRAMQRRVQEAIVRRRAGQRPAPDPGAAADPSPAPGDDDFLRDEEP